MTAGGGPGPPDAAQENQRLRREIALLRLMLDDVRHKLAEPEQIIHAIRSGEIDALMMEEHGEEKVFALQHFAPWGTLDAVLSAVQDCVYVLDREGRFVYANKKLLDLWGMPDTQFLGRTPQDLGAAPALQADLVDGLRQVVATRQPFRYQSRAWGPAGGGLCFENILAPILAPGGEVRFVAGSSRDITEHKRMEEELRLADRRKDDFLATLAHELRNPLAPIRNAVEILNRHGSQDREMQGTRDLIDRQVQHLMRLIEDLLDVSRIVHGRLELRREPVALSAVVERALETTRLHLERAGHTLTVLLPGEALDLYADPVRLSQVLANLLHNAAKYTDRGGRILLSAERQGAEAVLRVTDTGIGIAPERLPCIFDKFVQEVPALARAQGGLGIGLALARGLVELHGGTLSAHSDGPGKGSEFVVRLPLGRSASSAPPPRREAPQSLGAVPLRILLAEDNHDLAETLADLLSDAGHQVEVAYDGSEALAAAERHRPDVVLLDLGLPKLDGYAVCRRIREQPWGKGIVVIAQTGWGGEADRHRTGEASFDGHLVKPVDPVAMMKLLSDLPRRA